MRARSHPRRPARSADVVGLTIAIAVAVTVAGCAGTPGTGRASSSASASTAAHAPITGTGPVSVLYAGSLADLMNDTVGPGFDTATGFTFQGMGAGSSALATQIKGRTTKADVFISASPDVDTTLQGDANGDWLSWYATFASSKLVIGYNPKSAFASQLTSKPWYDVIGQDGFRFGSTDALLDPKGKLGNQALTDAATKHDQPALAALATGFETVQPEESLVGRLQAGQLDAAFFYASEAKAADIPTVPVTGEDLKAIYTIATVHGAPNQDGANAFVQYLLGSSGRAAMRKVGYDLTVPATVTGTGVPAALRSTFAG